MEKFTKGPWVQGVPTDKAPFCIDARCNNDGRLFEVCSVWGVDRDDAACQQSEANAALIAAAPEMYHLLSFIAETQKKNYSGAMMLYLDMIGVAEKINDLLAKARGE